MSQCEGVYYLWRRGGAVGGGGDSLNEISRRETSSPKPLLAQRACATRVGVRSVFSSAQSCPMTSRWPQVWVLIEPILSERVMDGVTAEVIHATLLVVTFVLPIVMN